MILSRRSIFSGCSIAVAVALPACEKPAEKNPLGMEFRDTYGPRPHVVKDLKGNLPVAKGRPTMAYMIEFPCTVRVISIDSGKLIAQADVKANDILAIEAKSGVSVNGKVLANGPLDGTMEYGIFCDGK